MNKELIIVNDYNILVIKYNNLVDEYYNQTSINNTKFDIANEYSDDLITGIDLIKNWYDSLKEEFDSKVKCNSANYIELIIISVIMILAFSIVSGLLTISM